ncbi:hypothetical protein KJ365_05675 [Glaciecola sp. XM2]|jgi:hypothetical protein|uniref:hypothetical protein n=1 Tax=Glaciecola sp. XM2 TaxID=1914931 RepID=UPI001BDF3227|nr:hypothetical protein [Glaciecola sp. XM2]MBT1450364.1 hypothetical protein [Glaciecola sp. XM2]
MKYSKFLLTVALTSAYIASSHADVVPVKFEFTQSGFYSYEFDQDNNLLQGALTNASITGSFVGKDMDGDGQIYARSLLASQRDPFPGPFGNELIYAEVTFNGFGTTRGPQTVVYDSRGIDDFGGPSDMTSLFSAFMGIAYNLDGGMLGDTADEGLSLSLFAPSTNYSVGSAFADYWANDDFLNSEVTSTCDTVNACGLVFEAVRADTISRAAAITPFFLSTETFQMRQVAVPTPTIFGLFSGVLGGLFMLRKLRKG